MKEIESETKPIRLLFMKYRNLLLFSAAIFLTACGGGYKTEFPPPTGEEKYTDIVPGEVAGIPMEGKLLELNADQYHGATFTYGEKATLLMVQCANEELLDAYMKDSIVPQIDEGYSSRVSGKFNGRWSARASGASGRFQAWQNGAYLFVIKAANDEVFDEIVGKFPYIAKK